MRRLDARAACRAPRHRAGCALCRGERLHHGAQRRGVCMRPHAAELGRHGGPVRDALGQGCRCQRAGCAIQLRAGLPEDAQHGQRDGAQQAAPDDKKCAKSHARTIAPSLGIAPMALETNDGLCITLQSREFLPTACRFPPNLGISTSAQTKTLSTSVIQRNTRRHRASRPFHTQLSDEVHHAICSCRRTAILPPSAEHSPGSGRCRHGDGLRPRGHARGGG